MTEEEARQALDLAIAEIEGQRYTQIAQELQVLRISLRAIERRYQRRANLDDWYSTCLTRSMDISATVTQTKGRLAAIEFRTMDQVQDALNDYNDAVDGRESDDDEAGNHATI